VAASVEKVAEKPGKKDPALKKRAEEDRKKKVEQLKKKVESAEKKNKVAKETDSEQKGEELSKPKKSINTMGTLTCFYIRYQGKTPKPLALEV